MEIPVSGQHKTSSAAHDRPGTPLPVHYRKTQKEHRETVDDSRKSWKFRDDICWFSIDVRTWSYHESFCRRLNDGLWECRGSQAMNPCEDLNMYQQIVNFWFEQIESALWWKKDDAFDALLVERFSEVHAQAVRCELFEWRREPEGRLAEIIVLDQFSRNMFRDTALAFASDAMSLTLSQEAVASGADQVLTPIQRSFLYMPFMHSESLQIHEVAVELFRKNGIQSNLEFEFSHKKIIERFGRYPHRNNILGRVSTAQEIEFLTQPGSGF